MQLNDRPGCRVEEAPGVVGLPQVDEASLLHQRDRLSPTVEHQQVDVRHRTVGHGVVEPLGNRGTLERYATHPALPEEFLDSARRIELAQPESEGLLVGAAQCSSGCMRPVDLPLSDPLMEKTSQTLLPRCLY
jgi:hypothetical protein